MTHSRLFAAAGIILAAIVLIFFLSVPHAHDVTSFALKPKTDTSVTTPGVVVLHDAFKKGVHTYSGTVSVPNVCVTVSAEAQQTGSASSTQSVTLAISVPANSGVCLQLLTQMQFSTTLEAPSGLPVTVTVNGALSSTTSS